MIDLTCVKCDSKNFSAKKIKVYLNDVSIETPAWVCDNCDMPLMSSEQMQECMDELRKLKDEKEPTKTKTQIMNERWFGRKEKKQHRPGRKHPWKYNVFKESIDKHVLNEK